MSRTNRRQYNVMLNFMEKNGDLNMPRSTDYNNCARKAEKWIELSKLLNSLADSGMKKTVLNWKKVWSDWKNNTKKKGMKIKRNPNQTTLVLTDMEKRLLELLKRYKKHVAMPDRDDKELHLEDEEILNLEEVPGDPLQDLKLESGWVALDQHDTVDNNCIASEETATAPQEPEPLSVSDNAVHKTSEESSEAERRREREEELHQLAVAERVWVLRTLRDKREWELKLLSEQHDAARLERERAQFQRDLAELQLRRARAAALTPAPAPAPTPAPAPAPAPVTSPKPDTEKKNFYIIVEKNKLKPSYCPDL